MIPDETIAEVLSRIDIVALVGRHVTLKKAGTLFKGLCPFHDEKTPSFTVSPTRNTYHCFGCGAHGHSIKFLMEVGARNFPEAVRELAGECGVEVPESRKESPEQREARSRKKSLQRRLLDVQDLLTTYYSDQLFGSQGAGARSYLQGRGLSADAATAFRLGWASGDKRAFATFIEVNKIDRDDLAHLGVLLPPDEGWQDTQILGGGYLRFRERLMFPVVDFRGDVTGYSGRILDSRKKIAKYMNSPETPVFTKGEQLYGAFTARSIARRAGRVILVEGNVDVVSLWQKGLQGTVAAMGTALTPEQVRLVKRLSSNVVCVMDGDEAGIKAAFSSLIPFLDAGIQPRAVMLDKGEDPDSYILQHGAERFTSLLDSAVPLLDLLIARAQETHPADPPGRLAALRSITPALTKLTDPLALELYRDRLTRELNISEAVIDKAIAEANQVSNKAPIKQRRDPEPRQDLPPVPASFEPPPLPDGRFPSYTGTEQRQLPQENRRKNDLFSPPGYISELFVFIVQYPSLVRALHAGGGHKLLTQPSLAGFVLNLYEVVSGGKTPNMDLLLSKVEHPEVVAFLRNCQSKEPVLGSDEVQVAFSDALTRLERGAFEKQVRRLNSEISQTYHSDPDRCAQLRNELIDVKTRLMALNQPKVELDA